MGTTKAELIEAHGAVRPRLAGHDKLIVHDANLHWFADIVPPVIDGIDHGLLDGIVGKILYPGGFGPVMVQMRIESGRSQAGGQGWAFR